MFNEFEARRAAARAAAGLPDETPEIVIDAVRKGLDKAARVEVDRPAAGSSLARLVLAVGELADALVTRPRREVLSAAGRVAVAALRIAIAGDPGIARARAAAGLDPLVVGAEGTAGDPAASPGQPIDRDRLPRVRRVAAHG